MASERTTEAGEVAPRKLPFNRKAESWGGKSP